jgi:hypothetical protein
MPANLGLLVCKHQLRDLVSAIGVRGSILSPHFEIRPVQSISPDAYLRVVSPR